MQLRRRHQEDDPRRGLLEGLQQRVERGLRQHVELIDDEDLVAVSRRRVARGVDQVAHVVDAGTGGGVHLDDV